MDLNKILGKLKPEDAPIKTIPEQDQLQSYLREQEEDVTFDKISNDTSITKERLLEINNEISIHYREVLAPKVLLKSMLKTNIDNDTEFQMFFQRPDTDLGLLFMSKISDIKNNMRNYNTPSWNFLMDNWKKYRGY